jgi:hypothetical protein
MIIILRLQIRFHVRKLDSFWKGKMGMGVAITLKFTMGVLGLGGNEA